MDGSLCWAVVRDVEVDAEADGSVEMRISSSSISFWSTSMDCVETGT